VQRRRRKKAEPKNIFGTSSKSPSSKPTKASRPQSPRQIPQRAPPSVPGSKPKEVVKKPEPILAVPEEKPEPPVENPEQEITESPDEAEVEQEPEFVEEQTLDPKGRKDIGLSNSESEAPVDDTEGEDGRSLKARQIIQSSMLKASQAIKNVKTKPVATPPETVAVDQKDTPKKPQRKFRNKMSSYQPASRAKRLDRSRHMEYKYEMRGLLVDIDVAEEHRSNLLATVWARGERQTTKEAKEFLEEKLTEGIIDEEQMKSLERIVDAYTIRR